MHTKTKTIAHTHSTLKTHFFFFLIKSLNSNFISIACLHMLIFKIILNTFTFLVSLSVTYFKIRTKKRGGGGQMFQQKNYF